MEKLSKEQVLDVANNIFETCDIIAKHGTSISSAMSIIDTGFDFDKTSMVGQKSKDPVLLCSYGWKENMRGDATNVILAIPKSFVMKLNNMSESVYEAWKESVLEKGSDAEFLFYAVSKEKEDKVIERPSGFPQLPPVIKRNVPKEFIKGFFVFCDNTNYLDFISNPEEALNHLSYVENENFFDNLTMEEQDKFVAKFKGENKSPSR